MRNPVWNRRNAVTQRAAEQGDGYRMGPAEIERAAALDGVLCLCGHRRDRHEVFDGECRESPCGCREFVNGTWVRVADELPVEGLVVETKIHDENGCRNITLLRRQGNLWFFPDMSMYAYYQPTHWRRPPDGGRCDICSTTQNVRTLRNGGKICESCREAIKELG